VFADQHDSDARSTGGTQRRFPFRVKTRAQPWSMTKHLPRPIAGRPCRQAVSGAGAARGRSESRRRRSPHRSS
jgi:hypothetical protein